MSGDSSNAIRLPFQTGEYLCTWQLPDNVGGVVERPGMLTVEPGKWPSGIVYGQMPIVWSQANGVRSAGFPQRQQFNVLRGRLSSGAYFALMNGEINYWFDTQGHAVGTFATLSRDEFEPASPRSYSSIEFQLEGLEAIAGVAPIATTNFPRDTAGEQKWAATLNKEASLEWKTGDYEMSFWYQGSFRSMDGYEFRMAFSPVLRLTSATPLLVEDWWRKWIGPLRQLISLATDAPRAVTYFCAVNGPDLAKSSRDQVFGWDLSHQPVNSTTSAVRNVKAAIRLKPDGINLLDLVVRWQELTKARHPLIETYGPMAVAADQHPRSRFLLLLQAIEGLYGFENKAQRESRQQKHTAERASFIDKLAGLLAPEEHTFLKRHLMRSPFESLESALTSTFKSLPIDVRPELELTDLVKQVREESGDQTMKVVTALRLTRNALSHGSSSFDPQDLREVALILDQVVRSEVLRILNAPDSARERALKKPE